MSEPEPEQNYEELFEALMRPNRSIMSLLFAQAEQDHEDAGINEVLDALDLPLCAPGETLYTPAPGEFHGFYDPHGKPFDVEPDDIKTEAMLFEQLRMQPENHLTASLWFEGTPVWVSTVYLGANHQFFPGRPPLIWETMIQTTFRWSDWQMRYYTRAGAALSHQIIVTALLEMGLVPAAVGEEPGSPSS